MTAQPAASHSGVTVNPGSLPSADVLAQPAKREMLWVSFGQWDRLKGRVTKLGNQRIDYVNYVVGAWGICIPCAISFLIYAFSDNRPGWALPVYGAVAVASGIAAKLLGKFQEQEGDIREEDATDIVAEMQSIEEAFLRTGNAGSQP
jgi:hypothetical protein